MTVTRASRPEVGLELHYDVSSWLAWEAQLLDEHRYRDWLALLADDVSYRMPVRVTTAQGIQGAPVLGGMVHFGEDRYTLGLRVERLEGDHAWTEDPPSRTRRFVTNVRVLPGGGHEEVEVRSYLLLFRSRGDVRDADLVSAERSDTLRRRHYGPIGGEEDGEDWCLARRDITVDEAVLRTQNLAVFL